MDLAFLHITIVVFLNYIAFPRSGIMWSSPSIRSPLLQTGLMMVNRKHTNCLLCFSCSLLPLTHGKKWEEKLLFWRLFCT